MPKRTPALVNPELLVWARGSARLTVGEAAKKAGITPERLAEWESGESRPTLVQARKLAKVYKRPLAILYLSEPPYDFSPLKDFRRLPEAQSKRETPELAFEIRRAHVRRHVAIELAEGLGEETHANLLPLTVGDNPEAAGRRIREALGVSLPQQRAWKTPYDALGTWTAAIERQNVLVFQARGVEISEMRGFSLSEATLPAIVLNIKDTPRGRVFTLLHEFSHVLLREGGLCDLHDRPAGRGADIEVFCNAVAGATLVPKGALLSHNAVQSRGTGEVDWEDSELEQLARAFQVSQEVILRRLLTFQRTTPDFYRRKRREFQLRPGGSQAEGFAPPHRMALATAGVTYTRLVLEGYHSDAITSADVSAFLGVQLKHLPRIEQELLTKVMKEAS